MFAIRLVPWVNTRKSLSFGKYIVCFRLLSIVLFSLTSFPGLEKGLETRLLFLVSSYILTAKILVTPSLSTGTLGTWSTRCVGKLSNYVTAAKRNGTMKQISNMLVNLSHFSLTSELIFHHYLAWNYFRASIYTESLTTDVFTLSTTHNLWTTST